MRVKIDFLILIGFIAVQWRINSLLFRAAARRLSGRRLSAARAGIYIWNVALVFGYLLSLSEFVSALHLPPRLSLYVGAATLVYLMMAGATLVLLAVIDAARRRLAPPHADPARRHVLNAVGAAMIASPFVVMGYGSFVQRTNFRVREVDVPVPELPVDLRGLRILHLSDIHLSAFLSESELSDVIDESNALRPHLAVVTGDLISSTGDPLDACLRQLARLRADAGVVGCMGNHERYARVEDYATRGAGRLGIRFLRQQNQALEFGGARLNLVGVDYQAMGMRDRYLQGAEKLVVSGATNILLSHNPDVIPTAAEKGFQVVMAGHTHGGQVTIEILDQHINPARFFTRFVYGLYREGATAAYVTRGIGTVGIPARIGAPPEITLLRLRKA